MKIPSFAAEVLSELEMSGHEARCVGGCVRDLLLGRTPGDWDITTSALPEEVLALFGERAIPTGLRHGTVTVCSGAERLEVTTYRCDGTYSDHRRPDSVVFTRSLPEDLRRRDFTVNAMAMDLRGELFDPCGGREDLRRGLLRCVGQPELRFEEDALRILRGLRFAAVLGFSPEEETARSIHAQRELLREIAPERIWTELRKLLCGERAAEVLRAFPDVLGVIWPEILPMVGFDQRNDHHCYDVWEHSLHALEAVPREDAALRCAALLHDVGKPDCFTLDGEGVGHFYGHGARSRELADAMLRRMKCETAFRERAVRLVDWHDRFVPPTEKGIRRALRRLGEEDLRALIALKRADNLAQAPAFRSRQAELDAAEAILEEVLRSDACFSLRQLAVNGNDLAALGLRGPEIGRGLDCLLDAVIDGALPNRREELLHSAEKLTGKNG